MRKILVLTVALALGAFGTLAPVAAGASTQAKKKPPVKLSGKVTNRGTKTVTGGEIEIEADDFSFGPTFVKGRAGEEVHLTVRNDGDATHTFTVDAQDVDEKIEPGEVAHAVVTIPDDGKAVEFSCRFHKGSGMRGAFFSKAGAKVSNSDSGSDDDASDSGPGYGY